ncbi:hypothetical protein [Halorubrum sp. AJ67]|uniref:hypothetical protein n=1 Tax=Halorubrum sp. AJ67 TaxID=1173487 RepID=UPI0003DDE01A|nr:hypothetical protein [Halorubrum sp. AJ67]CDK37991.1 hypothetical protein BN903_191 [Halorubrum sp. AJ67]
MDSKEILPGTERIQFLLDTDSLDNLGNQEYTTLEKLVRYTDFGVPPHILTVKKHREASKKTWNRT